MEHPTTPLILYDSSSGSGATPTHLAASGAHLQSLSCLIKHGAKLDVQTGSGELPIDFAKRTGNPNSFLKAGIQCKFASSVPKHEQDILAVWLYISKPTTRIGLYLNVQSQLLDWDHAVSIHQACDKYFYKIIRIIVRALSKVNSCV